MAYQRYTVKQYYKRGAHKGTYKDNGFKSKKSRVAELVKNLPKELLMEIVLFLQAPSSDILNFMLVCKSFNAVMKENYIWKEFCYRYFPQQGIKYFLKGKNESSPNFWKIFFKDNCAFGSRIVFCGSFYTIFLIKNKDGEKQLFGCGWNSKGQLGLGDKEYITKPCQLKNFPEDIKKIVKVVCGYSYTIFLIELKNGERQLFGCGSNWVGQLGLGYEKKITKPCQLKDFPEDIKKIINVVCGGFHTIFLVELKNGERKLFGCGDNRFGQLGLGDKEKITKPCQLKDFPEDIKKIVKVVCGYSCTIFLIELKNDERQLFGCGNNENGQLGFSDKEKITKPCQLKDFPEDFKKIVKVICGYSHTIFLIELENGERRLLGCGDNKFGQLGLGDKEKITKICQLKDFPEDSKIVNIFCGDDHTIFLIELKDGERQLFGCGNNMFDQLGLGDKKKITKPCQLENFPKDSKILNVVCGSFHTIFLIELKNGERRLFGCGNNEYGQLDLGDSSNRTELYQLKNLQDRNDNSCSSENRKKCCIQ